MGVSKLSALFLLVVTASSALGNLTTELVVSVPDQKLGVVEHGKLISEYAISTSKFGVGDSAGSYRTPLGTLFVSGKFGDNLRTGSVIKSRVPTGEVVTVDAPSRDAIVSRVIWLRGMEEQNRGAHERCIYIHGTPEERKLGRPASYGCIRMRSRDVIALYPQAHIGMHVTISTKHLGDLATTSDASAFARIDL